MQLRIKILKTAQKLSQNIILKIHSKKRVKTVVGKKSWEQLTPILEESGQRANGVHLTLKITVSPLLFVA
jgi:hypothetical protein